MSPRHSPEQKMQEMAQVLSYLGESHILHSFEELEESITKQGVKFFGPGTTGTLDRDTLVYTFHVPIESIEVTFHTVGESA